MAKFFNGQEKNAATDRFARADEFLTLFKGTDAQNGERPALRHAMPPGNHATRARIIQRPRARDIKIPGTAARAAPRPLRYAPRPPRARNANLARASSLFRAARREIFPLAARCAALRACQYPARCAAAAQSLLPSQSGESPVDSTRPMARVRQSIRKYANASARHRARPARLATNLRCRCAASRRACGIGDR